MIRYKFIYTKRPTPYGENKRIIDWGLKQIHFSMVDKYRVRPQLKILKG